MMSVNRSRPTRSRAPRRWPSAAAGVRLRRPGTAAVSLRRPVAAGSLALLFTLLLALLFHVPLADPVSAAADADGPDDADGTGEPVELDLVQPDEDRDRGSVEGELEPDGELRRAWVRQHLLDDGGRRTGERLEEIDEERIPIAVRVRYELDGESVRAEQLRGATGEAVVRIELRNPTSETRTVDLPGGGEEEVDVTLPLVAEGLLEFDDSWREIRADVARPAPAPDGGTRLRWSSALFEPVASATSRIEIRADVEGATLPHLEVEAIPATATNDLLQLVRDRATEGGTADAVAAFIADNLGDGLGGAADGADELAGGLEQTREGAGELNAAIRGMQAEIEDGFEELEEGLQQLDAGLAGIAEALARVEAGLDEVVTGITALEHGLTEAAGGAQTLTDEIAGPSEAAVRELWDVLAEGFTVGRADPAYVEAMTAAGELYALLTGELPPMPGDGEGGGQGVDEELAMLLGQIAELTGEDTGALPSEEEFEAMDGAGAALEDYPGLTGSLAELADGITEAAGGARQLAGAVDEIGSGVGEIRAGVQQLRTVLAEAGAGGPDVGDGDPEEMDAALGQFETALRELAAGGRELVGGLRQLEDGGGELVERLDADLEGANLDLSTVEALTQRAAEHLDSDDPEAVGGHERYLLVFSEESTSAAPAAALAGLLAIGGTLEVVRRRLTAG